MYTSNSPQNANVILTPRKAAFFCFIVWLMYLCTLKKDYSFWNPDCFQYLTLAKSLISLEGYKVLGTPHTRYPFGLPCLLAPFVGIFGYNLYVIQVYLITLVALALFVCFIFLRRYYNGKMADIAFLLTGISYPFWYFNCNFIASEIPYFLFSLLTLIAAQKYFKERRNVVQGSILLSLLILAAYFSRVTGIALFAAVIVLSCKDLLRKHKGSLIRLCVIFFICGSAIFIWFARGEMLTTTTDTKSYKHTMHTRSYKDEFNRYTPVDLWAGLSERTKALIRLKYRLIMHSKDITSSITSIRSLPFNLRFWWYLISLIFISGFLHNLFKRNEAAEWYLFFYMGILLVWPSGSVRFWCPVIPFIIFYLLDGIKLIKEKLPLALERSEGIEKGKKNWWKILFLILLFSGYFLVFIPLSETQYYESGALGYYERMVTFMFVILYFLMVSTSFIFAFYPEKPLSFIKKSITPILPHLLKILFAIIVFHNLSMIAYRTYLKHQDYAQREGKGLYFNKMGRWLKQNSNKSEVVMCDAPVAFGVLSERRSIHFPEVINTQNILDEIQKENVRYILVKNNDTPLLKNLKEIEVFSMLNFREILEIEGNRLFKIESRNTFNQK